MEVGRVCSSGGTDDSPPPSCPPTPPAAQLGVDLRALGLDA
jgi:hypothetical protein